MNLLIKWVKERKKIRKEKKRKKKIEEKYKKTNQNIWVE